jgi:ribonuclease HI
MDARLNIDGGSKGNPGPGAAGVLLSDLATGRPIHAAGFYLGHVTNNQAEYQGLIRGLEVAREQGVINLEICSDSQLMVMQIKGKYRVRNAGLQPLYEQAMALLEQWPGRWSIQHVYREQNTVADRLANQAIKGRGDVVVAVERLGSIPG